MGHIVFCGKDTECSVPQFIELPTPEITVDEVRQNSAMLNWTSIEVDQHEEFTEMAANYELKISQFQDEFGNLLNPTIIPIEADIMEYGHYYRLNGLAPGTTYYTEVNPVLVADCPVIHNDPILLKTQFTTLSGGGSEKPGSYHQTIKAGQSGTNKQHAAFFVSLRPNPATDITQISVSEGAIESVSILDNLGKVVKSQAGNQAMQQELRLDGVPKGLYWLRVLNTTGSVATVAFAKM